MWRSFQISCMYEIFCYILYLMNSPCTEQHSPTSNLSYPLLWNVSQLLIKKRRGE